MVLMQVDTQMAVFGSLLSMTRKLTEGINLHHPVSIMLH